MKSCFRERLRFREWLIDCELCGYHIGAAEDSSLVVESDAVSLAKQVAV